MSKVLPFPGRKRGDEFTAKKLEWIEAITLDTSIPAEAARLATLLALKFLNRNSGCAFPSQKTMGELLGIKERQVRRHMAALVNTGYVLQSIRGRNKPNVYKIALPAGHEERLVTDMDRSSEGIGTGRGKTGPGPVVVRPPNPMKEPIDEPSEGRPTAGEPTEGRSTLEVSRESTSVENTRLNGAFKRPRIFFVGAEMIHPERGTYIVTATLPAERRVKIRFTTGEEASAKVGAEDTFADDDLDNTVPF